MLRFNKHGEQRPRIPVFIDWRSFSWGSAFSRGENENSQEMWIFLGQGVSHFMLEDRPHFACMKHIPKAISMQHRKAIVKEYIINRTRFIANWYLKDTPRVLSLLMAYDLKGSRSNVQKRTIWRSCFVSEWLPFLVASASLLPQSVFYSSGVSIFNFLSMSERI